MRVGSINQPKADVTQIANAPGMVHSGCGLLTGSDFSVRSMCIILEGNPTKPTVECTNYTTLN